jgi:hypothetical protein
MYCLRLFLPASREKCGAEQGTKSLDLAKNRSFFGLTCQMWLLRRLFWLISATEGWFELPAVNWDTTGIAVIFVDPRGTSKTCRKCGHSSRSNRPNQSQFRCVKCNHQDNADGNASGNIADRGALLYDQGAL